MQRLDITEEQLVRGLLKLSEIEHVSVLDSCGVGHLGSHLLIAGVRPKKSNVLNGNPEETLSRLSELMAGDRPTIFSISYDFGSKLTGLKPQTPLTSEPDVFVSLFDSLLVHDYNTGMTAIHGDGSQVEQILAKIGPAAPRFDELLRPAPSTAKSNFTRSEYLDAVRSIQERIRCGDTYQTNLTQQLSAETRLTPQQVFHRLRRDHPAPFAAFITREDSTVVSASPERFFRIDQSVRSPHVSKDHVRAMSRRRIQTSPIKGTRPRGRTPEEDESLRNELLTSTKDRAENTMIVDLLRNDLGRVCEYGSVRVDKLCELEEHASLFHLVSTISGELRLDATFAQIIRALFPCGSITGAPKMSTMRIIGELEPTPRGLSMGAIGYSIPADFDGLDPVIDMSVAIRTMVIRDRTATFNVGGGITIDSDPAEEYEESLLKAKALLRSLNAELA